MNRWSEGVIKGFEQEIGEGRIVEKGIEDTELRTSVRSSILGQVWRSVLGSDWPAHHSEGNRELLNLFILIEVGRNLAKSSIAWWRRLRRDFYSRSQGSGCLQEGQ